jgi:hypothetical protein
VGTQSARDQRSTRSARYTFLVSAGARVPEGLRYCIVAYTTYVHIYRMVHSGGEYSQRMSDERG